MLCGSWIVVERSTGRAVLELYCWQNAAAINRDRFDVLCAYDYLTKLNARIKSLTPSPSFP